MNNINTHYERSKERLQEYAQIYYHQGGGKEKAEEYYEFIISICFLLYSVFPLF